MRGRLVAAVIVLILSGGLVYLSLARQPSTKKPHRIFDPSSVLISVVTNKNLGEWVLEPPRELSCGKIQCKFHGPENFFSADALLYHLPQMSSVPKEEWPAYSAGGQLKVSYSMEADPFTAPVQEDKSFMSLFDLHMSYARSSHVWTPYRPAEYPPKKMENLGPFEARSSELVFMSSRCETPFKRTDYVKKLMDLYPVHSYGKCLNNMKWNKTYEERENIWRKYRVCLAVENTIAVDYLTEKLWDPIRGGCVPVYLGAPNVRELMPHPKSAILVEDYKTMQELVGEISRVANNKDAFEEYTAWRDLPLESLSPNYTEAIRAFNPTHRYCTLCQKVHMLKTTKQSI